MRILLAGATGVIGRVLMPLLRDAGHDVVPMSRRAAAELPNGVACDALDAEAVRRAVEQAAPEVIIHQLTAIPPRIDPRRVARDFELTGRLRDEGTRNLVAAAPGVPLIAQSIAFAYAPAPRGQLHAESDRLFLDAAGPFRRTVQAIDVLEQAVHDSDGIVLRYGYFHGPGTALGPDGSMAADARRRRLPIVGDGSGVWSFIHIEDAARATLAALDRLPGPPATFNIVDDHPLRAADWLPAFAASVGAPRPLRVPEWLARLAGGPLAIQTMNRGQGASNELAKRELDWSPRHQPAFV